MATFKKYQPKNEKELHSIIEKESNSLEEGLELLKYEMGVGRSIPDFLCVDSGGRLVIIEVKHHEDENILFQALRYYSDIDKNRYVIANMFRQKKVNPKESPRIILIAEKFSDDIRRLSTLVVPDVELYEYTIVEDLKGNKGIIYHPVSLHKVDESLTEPATIEDQRGYITKEELKPAFDKVHKEIENIGEDLVGYATQSYVGYKYKGRQLAWISTQRKSFDVGVHIIDEKGRIVDYDYIRVEGENENYTDIIEKIRKTYQNLDGKIHKNKGA